MRSSRWAHSFVMALGVCAACGKQSPESTLPESGRSDGSAAAASVTAMAVVDAGMPDAGPPDGGVSVLADHVRSNEEWGAFWNARKNMSAIEEFSTDDEVVVGKVIRLGKEPGFWSGFATAWQDIDFEIVSTLKGSFPTDKITVAKTIAVGEPLVRHDRPGISPTVVPAGSKWIVGVVRKSPTELIAYDIVRFDARHELEVRTALARDAGNP